MVFVRVALAALALNLAVLLSGRRMPASPLVWRQWLVMGLRNNVVPFALIFWGQTAIGAGLAAILNATTPLLTALVASQFTADEPITANRLAGIALGLAGVVAIVGPAAFSGGGLLPRLAVIGAALSYAFAGVFGRRFRGQPPLLTATGQLTASSFLIAPVAFAVDQP